jgi:NAD(P)-dependent dehydrogenase (short-subunit alcohol dehydrogenase family)
MRGEGELAGKVLFVAGAGPMMGAATARVAAREGARVALAARSLDQCELVAAEIRSAGGEAIAIRCDLTDPASLSAAVDRTVAELGVIDCVFYNAGYYDNQHDSVHVDPEIWQLTMDVNFNGARLWPS